MKEKITKQNINDDLRKTSIKCLETLRDRFKKYQNTIKQ